MKNQLLKIATLGLFVTLISGFVAYRSGMWSPYTNNIQGSHNGGAIPTSQDSARASIEASQKLLLQQQLQLDSLIQSLEADSSKNKQKAKLKKKKKNEVIMSSSKSGAIFTPIETDTLKAKKRKKN